MELISKDDLAQIVELADSVPEKYQQVCFENLLISRLKSQPELNNSGVMKNELIAHTEKQPNFKIPIEVEAFLTQYKIPEETLNKLFLIKDSKIIPIYKIDNTKKTTAQIHYALLIALENALLNGTFKTPIDDLRKRCTDSKAYDGPNFMAVIKRNEKLFNKIDEDLFLTSNGKSDLSELIESLSNG